MGLIITLLVGALIGYLASLIVKTNDEQGFWGDMLAGLVGSWVARNLLGVPAGEFSLAGIFWGVIGAAVVILGYRYIKSKM